jgi:hypothetical protein
MFLPIFQVIPFEFLIFLICPFSCHIPGPTVCVSHFPRFSAFSSYSWSYNVHFKFSRFSVFLAIFQVLQFVFFIFNDFQFSRHIPGLTVYISHFPCF